MNPDEPTPAENAVGARKGNDGNQHMEGNDCNDSKGCEGSEVHGVLDPAAERTGRSADGPADPGA